MLGPWPVRVHYQYLKYVLPAGPISKSFPLSFFLSQHRQDGLVVEDMYIPKRSAQWVYKGYKIIKNTVEGGSLRMFRKINRSILSLA